jgi:DNA replication protein DnaC
MTAHSELVPSLVDRIKRTLVGLKMPRAIEILDVTVRRIERGEMTAIEAIDALLAEELTLRENRRIKIALMMARLSTIKTLAGFNFSFQPSLDKNRIMALAELEFIDPVRSCTFSDRRALGKATCPWRSAFKPSKLGAAFTSLP